MSHEAYCARAPSLDLTEEFDVPHDKCPFCNSRAISSEDHDFSGRRIDRCQTCALLFMNPQYTEGYLNQYYGQYGTCGNDTLEIPDPDNLSVRRVAAKADAFQLLARHTNPGRLLSIGCYDGVELLLAARNGWNPEGYDVDRATMNLLRDQVDFPIYSGDFFELGIPSDTYDCVFMDQVLEHPKNPQDYLNEVWRILRPGGVLYIGCPNIKSLSNRFKTVLGKWHLKKRRGKHYDMFHHLFFYDPRTLTRILETYFGFQIIVAQGDPIIGLKTETLTDNWRVRLSNWCRRSFPILESSFRLVVRKPLSDAMASTAPTRRAA